jgi:hypothetical protein
MSSIEALSDTYLDLTHFSKLLFYAYKVEGIIGQTHPWVTPLGTISKNG